MLMSIFKVVELQNSGDTPDEWRPLVLYILARRLQEVVEMMKDSKIESVERLCPVTVFPEQKYEVVEAREWRTAEKELEEDVARCRLAEELEFLEVTMKKLKRALCSRSDWANAAVARDVQAGIRRLLNEPVDLEDYFSRQTRTESVEETGPSSEVHQLYAVFLQKNEWFTIGDVVDYAEEFALNVDHDEIVGFFNTMADEGAFIRRRRNNDSSPFLFEYCSMKSDQPYTEWQVNYDRALNDPEVRNVLAKIMLGRISDNDFSEILIRKGYKTPEAPAVRLINWMNEHKSGDVIFLNDAVKLLGESCTWTRDEIAEWLDAASSLNAADGVCLLHGDRAWRVA